MGTMIAFAMLPEAPTVDGLRLLFYATMQLYIVQSISAMDANGIIVPMQTRSCLPATL